MAGANYFSDRLLHLIAAIHRQEIGRVVVVDNYGIGLRFTVSEYQFCRVYRISQRQRNVVHFLLVVDDDGIRTEGRYRQRVEGIVYCEVVLVYRVKIALHHGACRHGAIRFFRAGNHDTDYGAEDSADYNKSD